MKRVILNVAKGRWFPAGQDRLIESLDPAWGEQMMWRNSLPSDSPSHHESQYAFKVYAFREAQRLGYGMALWLDASVWAIRDIQPMWDHIEEHGHLFVEDGNRVGHFCTDDALDIMGVTRDEAMDMLIPVGACIGLRFDHPDASAFLDAWHWYAEAGAFRGPWHNHDGEASADPRCRGHRHDISVAGVILHRLGIPMLKPPTYYATWSESPAESVCVVARGMC